MPVAQAQIYDAESGESASLAASRQIALLHPWFLAMGGAEETVDSLARTFPEADVFCLIYEKKHLPPQVEGKKLTSLPIQWLPWKFKYYRHLLPLWPVAIESLDLRGYKIAITSDPSIMKGVLVDQDAYHICYCHSPMRCLWDLHVEYYDATPAIFKPLFALGAHYVRQWDYLAAQRVDLFVANSKYIQRRIKKYFGRDSIVIYPPVKTDIGYISPSHEDYYLSVGRLTAIKRIDLLIGACNRLGRRLVIAGSGREEKRLKAIAGPTIEFLGRVPDDKLRELYARCRAFLFAADEDFGIVSVEAQAFGRPVVAYGHGGTLETVRVDDPSGSPDTGVFFREQTVESVLDAIQRFESTENAFDPDEIQRNAYRFDIREFEKQFSSLVESASAGELIGQIPRT